MGDRVWGLYRTGRWYPATIAEARGDGRFVLSWDDGDSDDRVKAVAEVGQVCAEGGRTRLGGGEGAQARARERAAFAHAAHPATISPPRVASHRGCARDGAHMCARPCATA